MGILLFQLLFCRYLLSVRIGFIFLVKLLWLWQIGLLYFMGPLLISKTNSKYNVNVKNINQSVFPNGHNIITPTHPNLIITQKRHRINYMRICLIIRHSFNRLSHISNINYFHNILIIEDYCVLIVSKDGVASVVDLISADVGFCFTVVPYTDLF